MPSLEELQDEIKQRTDQIERVEADLKFLVGCENITPCTYIPKDKMDHEEYQATMLEHKRKIDSLQSSITASTESLTTMQKPYKAANCSFLLLVEVMKTHSAQTKSMPKPASPTVISSNPPSPSTLLSLSNPRARWNLRCLKPMRPSALPRLQWRISSEPT